MRMINPIVFNTKFIIRYSVPSKKWLNILDETTLRMINIIVHTVKYIIRIVVLTNEFVIFYKMLK